MTAPVAVPLPVGWLIDIDPDTRQLNDHYLFGGSPPRFVRLTDAGRAAWPQVQAGPLRTASARRLARSLTDAGLAHPRPPSVTGDDVDVTIVVPVRDREAMLERLLEALGRDFPVMVVDDGSHDAAAVDAVCVSHGAQVLRHDTPRGPAAARNTGLRNVTSPLVAFVDSDCVPPAGWVTNLAAHLADPLVGAAAARVTPLDERTAAQRPCGTTAQRYAAASASLDLGIRPARVVPLSRVSYVPTAALVVRAAAVTAPPGSSATTSDVFDEGLRYGEDVDLAWRLHGAGWQIRYDPSVVVGHEEPATWRALLARRFRYGTSAAPLGLRHPANVAPLIVAPLPGVAALAVLARRPLLALAAGLTSLVALRRRLIAADIPRQQMVSATGRAVLETWFGIGRWCTQFVFPVAVVACARPGQRRSAMGRRVAVAALVLGPPVRTWWRRRPTMNVAAFVTACLVDDIAYGAGVWVGCLRHRTTRPLRPHRFRRATPRPHPTSVASPPPGP